MRVFSLKTFQKRFKLTVRCTELDGRDSVRLPDDLEALRRGQQLNGAHDETTASDNLRDPNH